MTPHEKAVNAINARLERLQANLHAAKVEAAQHFLFQALVVTIAAAEALNDYAAAVGRYAQRRHGELKQANEALAEQHAGWLKSGQELLEKLKANPTDRAIRREIEGVQRNMAGVQKTLRRGANALQRELAPGLALVDEVAASVRRFADADGIEPLRRVLKAVVAQVAELYAAQPDLRRKAIIDVPAWETSALGELDRAADYYEAYARVGSQLTIALELMALALAENPPATPGEATQRANDAVSARLKEITARIAAV